MRYKNIDGLCEPIVDFLRYMDVVRNKSSNTINEYAVDLRLFIRYLFLSHGQADDNTFIDEVDISSCDISFLKTITLADAYDFMSYCKNDRNNQADTRARKTASIRAFFKFLTVNQKLLSENPMQELDTPKLKKALPKYLTLEQSLDLLGCIDGKHRERDYAIITIFLNCGIRLSELVGLNISDIRSDNTMRVLGKGNKERTVYLNNACISSIEAYLMVRPKDGVIDKNALFISNRGKRISPKTVQYIVKQFLEKAGLGGQGFSVHKLRHTAATLMYRYGDVDVLVLKEILGHSNIGTTEIYTHIVDDMLKQAVDANPLSNIDPRSTKN